MNIDFDRNSLQISSPAPLQKPSEKQSAQTEKGADFQSLLREKLNADGAKVSWSKHAGKRAQERSISVDSGMMDQLSSAVDAAEQKGIRDALILGGEAAFIVNVPSRTIVTTIDSEEMDKAVFTNIDGTVLL